MSRGLKGLKTKILEGQNFEGKKTSRLKFQQRERERERFEREEEEREREREEKKEDSSDSICLKEG